MATIRKPKLKRYPKRPRTGSTLQAWERYDHKSKEVEKDNAGRMADYHKKIREKSSSKKKKEAIIKRTSNLRGVALPKGKKR
jgi:hypothetical protein